MSKNNNKEKIKEKFNDAGDGIKRCAAVAGKQIIKGANKAGTQIKKGAEITKEKAQIAISMGGEKIKDIKETADYAILQPVFLDKIKTEEYSLPIMIRIDECDKKHKKNKICKGSIGFESCYGETKVFTVYPEYASEIGVTFENGITKDLYLVNPIDNKHYIPINDYFYYLKEKKINELCRIAQELGATKISISLKEEKKVFAKKTGKIKVGKGKKEAILIEADVDKKTFDRTEIVCKETYRGKDPSRPQLLYFKHVQDLNSLINARMSDNPLKEKECLFKYTCKTDLSVDMAAKIDAALKKMKYSGNATFHHEVVNENYLCFDYKILF